MPITEDSEPHAEPAFAGQHRLAPISLPLHEALGICLLFQAAPPELVQGLETQQANYGLSAAYGYLRIRQAIAELYEDDHAINEVVAERAMLDQIQ